MRIERKSLEGAITKVESMTLKDKEKIIDKIHLEQPNLLASVLVMHKMGNSLESIDVLLNILIVSYLALSDSGIRIVKISENLQEKEMTRLVGSVNFTAGLTASGVDDSLQQYIASHKEKYLLNYVLNEIINSGIVHLQHENAKYLMMVGINMVNCISSAELA